MPLGQPGISNSDAARFQPDEEALVHAFPQLDRKARGAFFTPAPLVELVLELAAALAPPGRPLAVIDPSCGAGAFLSSAKTRLPQAHLLGLELHQEAAAFCAERVSGATVLTGNALRDGWDRLVENIPPGAFELWVGNPPYNGTSEVLRDRETYAQLRKLMPDVLPKGTSLRDDYAFFLLRAAQRVAERGGVVAFVTSATLVDAYLYASLRGALLRRLKLVEVVELGTGVFVGTRVRTCVTVWTRDYEGEARYVTRDCSGPFQRGQLGRPVPLQPGAPDYLLRPHDADAARLDQRWREEGEALTTLVPVSSPGLKTRFDELLVDDDPDRLFHRISQFVLSREDGLAEFTARWGIAPELEPKLRALRASFEALELSRDKVRPFYRYAGARHRGSIPESARAWCYLDRALIPRGDHRLRGEWDPHLGRVKLVFNIRELPLSAALLEREGCVHDHRHARFAPLMVPERIRDQGVGCTRQGGPLGPLVPNLSPRGVRWAERLGGPRALYAALVAFINSDEVQEVWAPTFGAGRELHVTLERLQHHVL